MPEVIPDLVLIIGLFFAVVGYLTARGLLATWTHSLGYVFAWLASQLPDINTHIPGVPRINLKAPFQAIDNWVITALQTWADGAEIQMGYCLHGLEKVARYTAEALDFLARETDHTFDALVRVHLPKWAKAILAGALPIALLTKLIADQVRKALPTVRREIHTVTHTLEHVTVQTVKTVVRTSVAFPPWVIRLPGRVRGLEHDASQLGKRLRKVEGLFAAGVMAAVVANVLGVATRCLRSGNIGRSARQVCGADSSLIDSLLGDLLAITSVLSVVEFANELRAIEGEAIGIMGALVREWPS